MTDNLIMVPINPSPDKIVKERHVCYYTHKADDHIWLCEVLEVYYKHPQAPDDAFFPIFETRHLKKYHRTDAEAAALIVLEASQKSVAYQNKRERVDGMARNLLTEIEVDT